MAIVPKRKTSKARKRKRRAHQALSQPNTSVKLFGKPAVSGRRRMGVALARADSVEAATSRAISVASAIKVTL